MAEGSSLGNIYPKDCFFCYNQTEKEKRINIEKTLDLELTPRYIMGSLPDQEMKKLTIKEVCERYHISADTLRYYEKVGVIPKVPRTKSGIRNYGEPELKWVENALCMRNAGVPVEIIIEYVSLYQQGNETFAARRDLLKKAQEAIIQQIKRYQDELERLEYKIARYEDAVRTGELVWDKDFSYNTEMEQEETTVNNVTEGVL